MLFSVGGCVQKSQSAHLISSENLHGAVKRELSEVFQTGQFVLENTVAGPGVFRDEVDLASDSAHLYGGFKT